MTRRVATTLAFAAAVALALAFASPARACDCARHAQSAASDKKADGKAAAVREPAVAAEGCQCEKGGKNCTCPKGKCDCPNCHEGKPKDRA